LSEEQIFQIKFKNMPDIFDACRNGDLETLQKIYAQNPASINIPSDKGFTPLVLAVYSNQTEAVSFLLSKNAEIDGQDMAGNTALMGAVFKGYENQINLLLENGASVNIQNQDGATALIYAVMFDKTVLAKLLLKAGADSSIKDGKGQTALDYVKGKGNEEILDILKG
jgi:ankyrin repeat protein